MLDLHTGPVPGPEVLREYRELIPNAPERFLAAFEKQVEHRHTLEETHLEAENRRADRGQHYALSIFILGLVATFVLGLLGHWIVATAFLTSDFVGGAGTFITGKVIQSRERIQRARIMTGQE